MGAPEFDEVLAPNSGGIRPNLSTRSRIKKVKNRCPTSLIKAKLLPEIIHFFVTKKSKKELDQKYKTATT